MIHICKDVVCWLQIFINGIFWYLWEHHHWHCNTTSRINTISKWLNLFFRFSVVCILRLFRRHHVEKLKSF
jgi:hypothetical protein